MATLSYSYDTEYKWWGDTEPDELFALRQCVRDVLSKQ